MKNFGFRGKCTHWLFGALLACLGAPAIAATYAVTNANDAGAGSLRQAMLDAIATPEADSIIFSINGVITLQSALPVMLSTGGALTITGNGANITIIDGAGTFRPFSGDGINLIFELRNIALRNGRAPASEHGGAIRFTGATLVINAVEFRDNSAAQGGGGAIFATANTIRVEDSAFRGNSAAGIGSVIQIDNGGDVDIVNSTVLGDGIASSRTISITGNIRTRIMNTTVNAAGSSFGILQSGANMSVVNSLLTGASNTDFWVGSQGTFDSAGSRGNVIGSSLVSVAGGANWHSSNQLGVSDPLLGSIGTHGGPTSTMPLLPGSRAIDAGVSIGSTGSNLPTPVNDQRGVVRAGAPDAGAFESRGFTLSRAGGNNQSTTVSTPFADPLAITITANNNLEPVTGGAVRFIAPASGASASFAPIVASIDSNAYAQTTATANATAGGPYSVTATLPGGGTGLPSVTFSLTNTSGADPACVSFVFPYTLAGSDNTARVAELRQAIECANANISDDVIDLGGNTLIFGDGPYSSTALPLITSTVELRNGELERQASVPGFRLIYVDSAGMLTVRGMALRGGSASNAGGAILANGPYVEPHVLTLIDSVFENNSALGEGGAVASWQRVEVQNSRFTGNAAGGGAAISTRQLLLITNSRFEGNGDGDTKSVLTSTYYTGILNSLFADNHLTAAQSSLMYFDGSAVAEFRNVTIARNSVQSALLRWPTSAVQVRNSIVWDNEYGSLGNVSPIHSILPGFGGVNGNLDQPPGFVGPGDYHLDAGSPAIDAGDNSYGSLADLDLNPRPLDDTGVADTGNGTAPIIDMGAYEYQSNSVVAGITITPTSGLVTTEAGGSATFTVVLDRYPKADVTLPLSSSDTTEGLVAPTSLTFTQANWNQPQTVTITGVDDGVIDGDQPYTIVTGSASSADPAYNGIDPLDVSVVNQQGAIPSHSVGGTVIGLRGSGLVLSLDEVSDSLPIAADGSFAFASAVAQGATYTITIATQPQAPAQACVVINGSGTMGVDDIDNVIVNCGASDIWAIGGTVSGLDGGSLVLQLNGGGDLAVSADGSYAFASRLVDGASYVVTVKTQPQGQLCTLSHAGGTVQGADVTNVDANCAPLATELNLSVDDGREFARYGHVRDYFVTLGNTGNVAANGVTVAGTFSAAFDAANVRWQCLGGASSCASNGVGGFSGSANLPPNSAVTWIVSVPVLADSDESDATFTVDQSTPALAGIGLTDADTDTLVIFRDGVDVPYGDGARVVEPLPLPDERSVPIDWPPPSGAGIAVVQMLQTPQGTVEVQRLNVGGADFVRLLGTHHGQQHASDWARVAGDARLVVGRVAGAANTSIVLLEGAARPLALPQRASDTNGEMQ